MLRMLGLLLEFNTTYNIDHCDFALIEGDTKALAVVSAVGPVFYASA